MSNSSIKQRPHRLTAWALAAATLAAGLPAAAAGYKARALEFPQDMGHGCSVSSMTDKAEMTGGCYTPDEMFSVGFSTRKNGKQASDLGLLSGTDSYGFAINTQGVVVGEASLAGDETYHAVLRRPGDSGLTDLGTLGGQNSFANSINDKGQIVGVSDMASGDSNVWLSNLTDTRLIDIGNMGGFYIVPRAINNKGTIVGYGTSSAYPRDTRAFYAKAPNYAYVDLGTLGGPRARAWAINDKGQIVGGANFDATRTDRAFIADTSGGAMKDLGTPAGQASTAYGINGKGQVVGQYRLADNSAAAFVCSGNCSDFVDLNTATSGIPDGVTLISAKAINSKGQIVATGSDNRQYLLTPR